MPWIKKVVPDKVRGRKLSKEELTDEQWQKLAASATRKIKKTGKFWQIFGPFVDKRRTAISVFDGSYISHISREYSEPKEGNPYAFLVPTVINAKDAKNHEHIIEFLDDFVGNIIDKEIMAVRVF